MTRWVVPYLAEAPTADGHVVCALATGAIVSLSSAEYENLQRAEDPDGVLTSLGMLTHDREETRRNVVERHREARLRPAVFNLTLLPTLACDLACRYCFEQAPAPKRMSDAVCDAVVALAARQAVLHLRLDVSWFGGEPLLALDTMEVLHPRLVQVAAGADTPMFTGVTTNGHRLDATARARLRALGIHILQITIDGDQETHDAQRPTRTGEGTYLRILDNLVRFLDEDPDGKLVLRVNADAAQVARIGGVLSAIPAASRPRVSIHLNPILPVSGPDCVPTGFMAAARVVYQTARELGFGAAPDNYLDPRPGVYCYAERSTSVVVDPGGWIYKCAYCCYREADRIGRLRADGTIEEVGGTAGYWVDACALEPSECLDCRWLPVCNFGCPRLRDRPRDEIGCRERFACAPDSLSAMVAEPRGSAIRSHSECEVTR